MLVALYWRTHTDVSTEIIPVHTVSVSFPTNTPVPTAMDMHPPELSAVIQEAMKDTTGEYGIAIKNLTTGQEYFYNEHIRFEAASLYKLWVMATVFRMIESGELSEDEVLSQDISVLNEKFDIASEAAEQTEGSIRFTVHDAIEQMITVSDNYEALLLSERVGLSRVSAFMQDNGFTESSLGTPPKTTAHDVSVFLEKLYTGTLSDPIHTYQMIELLKRQTINGKLPKYIPADVQIAHKTGEIGMYTHDAGIIFSQSGTLIVVVLTHSENPPGAEERISEISNYAYHYFNELR